MEAALEDQVNLVNAEVLAKERGIAIVEEKTTDPGDFGTMIQTEVTTDKKTYVAAGTLFGKEFLRLVRLGPYRLDAHLDGNLLIFTHRDVPGLIGFIGTTFGRHGVNIAQMNVGREADSPAARRSASSTSTPSPPRRRSTRSAAHPDILSVSLIKLPEARRGPALAGSDGADAFDADRGSRLSDPVRPRRRSPVRLRARLSIGCDARRQSSDDGHRLELGVVVERLLAQLAADAARLEAAERGGGVEDVVAVDPDGPGADAVGDRVGLADVAGPDRGGEAVVGRVGPRRRPPRCP